MTDRTSELQRSIQIMYGGNGTNQHRPLSDYARKEQQITDEVRELEELTNRLKVLVEYKGTLNDPTKEIESITSEFKKDVMIIQKDLADFMKLAKTARKQHCEHLTVIVKALNQRLGKSGKTFQEAIKIRTNVIKQQSTRRSKFSYASQNPILQINSPLYMRQSPTPTNNKHTVMQPSSQGGNTTQSSLTAPNGFKSKPPPTTLNSVGKNGSFQPISQPPSDPFSAPLHTPSSQYLPRPGAAAPPPVSLGGDGGLRRRGGPGPPQGQTQLQMSESSRSVAQQRYRMATQVEKNIQEMTQMFSSMASVVEEQGHLVARIDDDMDVTTANVEAGSNEIMKFFNTMSGNRSLILKIFAVLIFFIFIFVVVAR